eukprot:scaffold76587_cov73-Phaeocystis_antarctica.AAC.2
MSLQNTGVRCVRYLSRKAFFYGVLRSNSAVRDTRVTPHTHDTQRVVQRGSDSEERRRPGPAGRAGNTGRKKVCHMMTSPQDGHLRSHAPQGPSPITRRHSGDTRTH